MKTNNLLLTLFVTAAMATASYAAPAIRPVNPTAAKSMAAMPAVATSSPFKGAEVNGGTASIVKEDGKTIVRLSDDFKIPASPSPHFQIVDADGNVFLLQRLTLVGNKTHREVALPRYIKSVARVQIWCSFAEVVLGEASFAKPIRIGR